MLVKVQSKPAADLMSKANRVINAILIINKYSKNTGPNLLEKILLMNLEIAISFKFTAQI